MAGLAMADTHDDDAAADADEIEIDHAVVGLCKEERRSRGAKTHRM